ncbi:response regulator [Terricaulis silvestris]|uniref:Chemotaxis protein CheY n=1 Tax=Terricaulis silvestris TaxID=2686094 RepID=A0A6I6MKV5_9CAUL|nr:response regulator [Terricaulis silvestris]QGZ93868.1 Chemotaxis protein CheY [Terricaulis silvestris]
MTAALSVLIADDHEPMRALLRKVLERAGVGDVRDVKSGAEALAALQERRADLLLADMTIPEMDGVALTERVRADYLVTRVIMITGRADARTRDAARAAGADAVLVKPVAPRDLLAAIEQLFTD